MTYILIANSNLNVEAGRKETPKGSRSISVFIDMLNYLTMI